MAEAATQTKLVPIHLPPVEERRLRNGLTVYATERHLLPLATAVLVIKGGTSRDPKGKAGLTDFMVEQLRRGTADHTAEQIDELLEVTGADLRLDAGSDSAFLSCTAPSEHFPLVLSLLAELAQRASFPNAEVLQARKRTLANLEVALDDPATLARDATYRMALAGHPYAMPGRGLLSTVKTFTRKDCLAQYEKQFRPEGAILVVGGDVVASDAFSRAEKLFGKWKGKPGAVEELPEVPEVEGKRVFVVDRPEATQTQIRIACRGAGRRHPEIVAMRLANDVFGGGFTSRLVDAIRVRRGLSYSVGTYFSELEAGGLFVFSSFTKNETVGELVGIALDEAARMRGKLVEDEELERTRRYTNGLYPLSLETDDAIVRSIAEMKRYGRPDDWLSGYRERVLEVTREQVQSIAERFFMPEGYVVVAVGRAKDIVKQLEPFGTVKVIKPESLA